MARLGEGGGGRGEINCCKLHGKTIFTYRRALIKLPWVGTINALQKRGGGGAKCVLSAYGIQLAF